MNPDVLDDPVGTLNLLTSLYRNLEAAQKRNAALAQKVKELEGEE